MSYLALGEWEEQYLRAIQMHSDALAFDVYLKQHELGGVVIIFATLSKSSFRVSL